MDAPTEASGKRSDTKNMMTAKIKIGLGVSSFSVHKWQRKVLTLEHRVYGSPVVSHNSSNHCGTRNGKATPLSTLATAQGETHFLQQCLAFGVETISAFLGSFAEGR